MALVCRLRRLEERTAEAVPENGKAIDNVAGPA